MLHILWIVIKFILILLGVLLGLVLLGVVLVLFCPVRYRVTGELQAKWRQSTATGKVSWLWGLLSFQVYFREGALGKNLKIAGISLHFSKKQKKRKTGKTPKNGHSGKDVYTPAEAKTEYLEDAANEEFSISSAGEFPPEGGPSSEGKDEKIPAPEKKRFRYVWEKLLALSDKIRAAFQKVPERLHKIRQSIQRLRVKAKWWREFLEDPGVRSALSRFKKELGRFLHHIFPTRVWGEVTLGFEDPSMMGKVLAILGMSFPFHKNRVCVVPIFESKENYVQGHLALKGRVYGIILLKTAVGIYFNEHTKYVLRRWKHKEDEYYGE